MNKWQTVEYFDSDGDSMFSDTGAHVKQTKTFFKEHAPALAMTAKFDDGAVFTMIPSAYRRGRVWAQVEDANNG